MTKVMKIQKKHQVKLKKIRLADIPFLFSLSDNPKVKKYARKRGLFSISQYMEDLRSDIFIIILNLTGKNIRIGALRVFNKEISIAILPKYWKQGYGKTALQEYFKIPYVANISLGNNGSLCFFKSLGFKVKNTEDFLYLRMEKNIPII